MNVSRDAVLLILRESRSMQEAVCRIEALPNADNPLMRMEDLPIDRTTKMMGLDKCDCASLDGKTTCPNKPEHLVRVPDYMHYRSTVLHLCHRCYSNYEILFQQQKPR